MAVVGIVQFVVFAVCRQFGGIKPDAALGQDLRLTLGGAVAQFGGDEVYALSGFEAEDAVGCIVDVKGGDAVGLGLSAASVVAG